MLVIRDAVWEKLGEAALADFIARMRVHLRRFFPEVCERLGEERTGQFIEAGIGRARHYGFKAEREVCKYIDLMCVFGHDFQRLPWARRILEGRLPPDPNERMRCLHTTAIAALGAAERAQ
jgi:hypothetical protein